MNKKVFFVSGSIYSASGKGCLSVSLSKILSQYRNSYLKIDPYLNLSAGNLNPKEHGEVFVTSDGYESDPDLGTYERITGLKTNNKNNFTGGQWIKFQEKFISKINGKTLRLNFVIKELVKEILNREEEVLIIEWGGCFDDPEAYWFEEFVLELKKRTNLFHIHLIPLIESIQSQIKTRPSQVAMKIATKSFNPDCFLLRCSNFQNYNNVKHKFKDFIDKIKPYPNVTSLYYIPFIIYRIFKDLIKRKLKLNPDISDRKYLHLIKLNKESYKFKEENILFLNKYFGESQEVYTSLLEAIKTISTLNRKRVIINTINTTNLNFLNKQNKQEYINKLKSIWYKVKINDKVIIPGGFGSKSWDIHRFILALAFRYHKAIFCICWGFQMLSCYLASNYGDNNFYSSEESINLNPKTKNLILKRKMLLGDQIFHINKKSFIERFRNRYHVLKMPELSISKELILGYLNSEKSNLVYIFWERRKIWGVQFHPEFTTSWYRSNEFLLEFIKC